MFYFIFIGVLIVFGFFSWRKFLKSWNPGKIRNIILGSKYKLLEPYIFAQAQVETGDFSSRLFTEANNLFGMRCATVRKQNRIACLNNYAVFYSPEDSVKDYLSWLEYSNFPTSVINANMFVYELKKRRYFTDSYDNYLKLLKSFL